jgi:hypothetical protein
LAWLERLGKKEVGFGPFRIAWNGRTRLRTACNGISWFWPELTGFPNIRVGYVGSGLTHFRKRHEERKKRKSKIRKERRKNSLTILLWLEWLRMEKVGFWLTWIAWNVGRWFLPDLNGLEWRKSVLSWLEYLW